MERIIGLLAHAYVLELERGRRGHRVLATNTDDVEELAPAASSLSICR